MTEFVYLESKVSGELMFLQSYGNRDVTNKLTLFLDVRKQFLITISFLLVNSELFPVSGHHS